MFSGDSVDACRVVICMGGGFCWKARVELS